jgi:ABC-type glycerol-3-phosphate transport system permease component
MIWDCFAFVALVLADGLIEIQLSPKQSSGELHWLTFWLGMLIPFVLTSFPVIRMTYMLISTLIDIDTYSSMILPFVIFSAWEIGRGC